MAARSFNQNAVHTLEKKLVRLFATVNIGATGAPTLQAVSGPGNARTLVAASAKGFNGIKSITRSGAGTYVLALQDAYQRVLGLRVLPQGDAAPAAPVVTVSTTGTNVRSNTAPQITFVTRTAAAGHAATDPANGEVLHLVIELADSTAP